MISFLQGLRGLDIWATLSSAFILSHPLHWIDQCPPTIRVYLEPVNGTLLGNRDSANVLRFR